MKNKEISPILKVITVDDSPIVAERLQTMLKEVEYTEFSGNASNISSALYLIDQQRPNMVILDIHLSEDMPKANGITLLILLRQKYPEMKIMMLTNITAPQYRDTCMTLGADYFLDKSNDFDKIPVVLSQIAQAAF